MGRIGLPEIIIVCLVIVFLFGAKKLPELAQSIGKALKEFRKASKDLQDEVTKDDRSDNS